MIHLSRHLSVPVLRHYAGGMTQKNKCEKTRPPEKDQEEPVLPGKNRSVKPRADLARKCGADTFLIVIVPPTIPIANTHTTARLNILLQPIALAV